MSRVVVSKQLEKAQGSGHTLESDTNGDFQIVESSVLVENNETVLVVTTDGDGTGVSHSGTNDHTVDITLVSGDFGNLVGIGGDGGAYIDSFNILLGGNIRISESLIEHDEGGQLSLSAGDLEMQISQEGEFIIGDGVGDLFRVGGILSPGVGINTYTPDTDLHIQENNSDTKPTVEIEQLGTGDSGIQISNNVSFALGVKDDDIFYISRSLIPGDAVLGTDNVLKISVNGDIDFYGTLSLRNNNVSTGSGLGTIIALDPTEKIGFWGVTPIEQPDSGISESVFVENSGGSSVNVDSTFGGYTLQQVVQALKDTGILA